MELLMFFGALCALAVLAVQFGADSRPRLRSEEEQLARYGVVWESGASSPDIRLDGTERARHIRDVRAASATVRLRLAGILRSIAARLDTVHAAQERAIGESLVSSRVAQAGDRAAVRAFLRRLSPSTVAARFMSPPTSWAGVRGDRELERLLDTDRAEHVVVLAVEGTDVRGIGEFVNGSDPAGGAELAMVVEDDFQGRGIGRMLFRDLEQLALQHGIRAFTGDMAHGNARAAALLRWTGRISQMQVSHGAVRFRLRLGS